MGTDESSNRSSRISANVLNGSTSVSERPLVGSATPWLPPFSRAYNSPAPQHSSRNQQQKEQDGQQGNGRGTRHSLGQKRHVAKGLHFGVKAERPRTRHLAPTGAPVVLTVSCIGMLGLS